MTDHSAAIRELAEAGYGDAAIGERIGLTKMAVYRRRHKLGIGANIDRFVATPEQLAELRTASNREMERRHGVSAETWSKIRRRHGIEHFRLPTTGPLAPAKKEKPRLPSMAFSVVQPTITQVAPMRDHSLVGEAMAWLQKERFTCFSREKVLGKPGYAVGRMVKDAAGVVEMAKRYGFEPRPWMGGL